MESIGIRTDESGEFVVNGYASVILFGPSLSYGNSQTSTERGGGGGRRATAYQLQRRNEPLQVLLLQRMEDAFLQIVQE